MTERTRAPSRCNNGPSYEPCQSSSFRKEDGRYVCTECGTDYAPVVITATELRLATCDNCKEPFLWRWSEHSIYQSNIATAPGYCGACHHLFSANSYIVRAKRHREQAEKARAQQRRAVARFKPAESLADQQARSAKVPRRGA
jgi:DNA-directed RNA polymerase subunit RPC12/RpoP